MLLIGDKDTIRLFSFLKDRCTDIPFFHRPLIRNYLTIFELEMQVLAGICPSCHFKDIYLPPGTIARLFGLLIL